MLLRCGGGVLLRCGGGEQVEGCRLVSVQGGNKVATSGDLACSALLLLRDQLTVVTHSKSALWLQVLAIHYYYYYLDASHTTSTRFDCDSR